MGSVSVGSMGFVESVGSLVSVFSEGSVDSSVLWVS